MKCFEGQIGRGGLTIEKVKEELQEVRVGRGEGGQEGLQHMMKEQQAHQFTWIEREVLTSG